MRVFTYGLILRENEKRSMGRQVRRGEGAVKVGCKASYMQYGIFDASGGAGGARG